MVPFLLQQDNIIRRFCRYRERLKLVKKRNIMKKTATILVIDDYPAVRSLLESTLAVQNFKVISAENGRKGLEIARAGKIDVILLDWVMPEMDGMEVLAELKCDSNTMDIPVIMLTSKGESCDIKLAASKGAVDYIVKPFKPYEVSEVIQKHLEKAHHKSTIHGAGFFSKIFTEH